MDAKGHRIGGEDSRPLALYGAPARWRPAGLLRGPTEGYEVNEAFPFICAGPGARLCDKRAGVCARCGSCGRRSRLRSKDLFELPCRGCRSSLAATDEAARAELQRDRRAAPNNRGAATRLPGQTAWRSAPEQQNARFHAVRSSGQASRGLSRKPEAKQRAGREALISRPACVHLTLIQ